MCRRALQAIPLLSILMLVACSQTNIVSPPSAPGSPSAAMRPALPTGPALPTAPLSVYIGSTDGTVAALDATSGAVRWRSPVTSAGTPTVAALAEGAVYVSATDANGHPPATFISALRASDGSALWHKTLAGTTAIVGTGPGVVYLALDGGGSTPHEIQMLRALDGAMLWRTQVAGTGPLHASVHEGTIYVTSFGSQLRSPGYYYASTALYALNARTGALYWHSSIARTNYLAAVVNDEVYLVDTGTDVVCEPNVLHVLSASDGAERWHMEGTLVHLIGVEQGRAYVSDVPEGCSALAYDHIALYALNTCDGSSVWQLALQSPYYGGPFANGVIYLPAEGTALAAYRATDGSRLWHVQGESGRLWVLDEGLYTAISGRGLDALDPATGVVRWRYQTSDEVSLSSVAKGILYGVSSRQVTGSSRNQAIVAITANDGKLRWSVQIGTSEESPIVG